MGDKGILGCQSIPWQNEGSANLRESCARILKKEEPVCHPQKQLLGKRSRKESVLTRPLFLWNTSCGKLLFVEPSSRRGEMKAPQATATGRAYWIQILMRCWCGANGEDSPHMINQHKIASNNLLGRWCPPFGITIC